MGRKNKGNEGEVKGRRTWREALGGEGVRETEEWDVEGKEERP